MKEIFLASKSPRRQQLLRAMLDSFLVIDSEVDEIQKPGERCEKFTLRLAEEKAFSARDKLRRNAVQEALIVAADTIVVDQGEVLGKPLDAEDAYRILTRLRGKTHQVMSGIALLVLDPEQIFSRVVKTEVKMRDYSEVEICHYIDSGDPFDKAGAYGIQNPSFNPAPDFTGCYANVMGLPLCHLSLLMKSAHCQEGNSVAERCQKSIHYQCPVHREILAGGGAL
jgi:septum formation protein